MNVVSVRATSAFFSVGSVLDRVVILRISGLALGQAGYFASVQARPASHGFRCLTLQTMRARNLFPIFDLSSPDLTSTLSSLKPLLIRRFLPEFTEFPALLVSMISSRISG